MTTPKAKARGRWARVGYDAWWKAFKAGRPCRMLSTYGYGIDTADSKTYEKFWLWRPSQRARKGVR